MRKVLIFVFFFVSPVFASEPAEQRCLDIVAAGGTCCSEPQNTLGYTVDIGHSSSGSFAADPDDSNGGGSLPCRGGNPMDGTTSAGNSFDALFTPEIETKMPIPNAVSYVLHMHWINPSNVNYAHMQGPIPASNVRRLCMRHYENVDPGWVHGATCNNKTMALGWTRPDTSGIILPVTDYVSGVFSVAYTGGWSSGSLPSGCVSERIPRMPGDCPAAEGTFDLNSYPDLDTDGTNGWIGVEECVSGNILAGTNITVELHSWVAGGGKTMDVSRFVGDATGATSMQIPWIQNMYIEGVHDYPTCPSQVGRRYSHAVQASWTTSAGQRIGPSIEVEPSGSLPPPPPLPPPTLLPGPPGNE